MKPGAMQLVQHWPRPVCPRPIVRIGAGDIVRDAHRPAYRQRGLPVAGGFDPRSEAGGLALIAFYGFSWCKLHRHDLGPGQISAPAPTHWNYDLIP